MAQDTDEYFTLIEIPDSWEPSDEDEAQQRGLFLAHAVDGHLRQNLFQLISKCKAGSMGKEAQQAVQHRLNEWSVAAAIKESTCVCIHRAWTEQGGEEASPWLLDFVLLSHQEVDAICAQPDSADIIEHCERLPVTVIMPELIAKLGKDFGFSAKSEAGLMLQNILLSSAGLTRELLVLALTQSLESLARHLQMYQR